MMAIGETGTGKSSLLNALLCPKELNYKYEDCYFQTGNSIETAIEAQTGSWLDNLGEYGEYRGEVTLYDTPGILDQTGGDVNYETTRQIARHILK
jgi:predicted GTPase